MAQVGGKRERWSLALARREREKTHFMLEDRERGPPKARERWANFKKDERGREPHF